MGLVYKLGKAGFYLQNENIQTSGILTSLGIQPAFSRRYLLLINACLYRTYTQTLVWPGNTQRWAYLSIAIETQFNGISSLLLQVSEPVLAPTMNDVHTAHSTHQTHAMWVRTK